MAGFFVFTFSFLNIFFKKYKVLKNTIHNPVVRDFCEEHRDALLKYALEKGIIDEDYDLDKVDRNGEPSSLNFALTEAYSRVHGEHITDVLRQMQTGILAFSNASISERLDGEWETTGLTKPLEIKIRHSTRPYEPLWIDEDKFREIYESDAYLAYGWRHPDNPAWCNFGVWRLTPENVEIREGAEVRRNVSQSYEGGVKETPCACFYLKDLIWSGTTAEDNY